MPRIRFSHRRLLQGGAICLAGLVPVLACTPAAAQSVAARQGVDAAGDQPLQQADTTPDDRAAPLSAGRKQTKRILSRNEIYNLQRAAEGRVSKRLGNDMSFPVVVRGN